MAFITLLVSKSKAAAGSSVARLLDEATVYGDDGNTNTYFAYE